VEFDKAVLEGRALTLAQGAAIALVALKLVQLFSAGPFMDETYYWMWGQHPALSYYDHPPLNAWLLWASSALFGGTLFALRLPVALSFFAEIVALRLLARRIGGAQWRGYFWLTVLLFLATPMYWALESYALPDHVLLASCLFAIACFYRFFADRAEGRPGASRDLLAGAFCLGFAGLAKYNGAFLGLGVAGFVLVADRALLRQGRLYLAAAVTLLMQAPVVAWNLTEGLASWNFIVQGRNEAFRASLGGVYPFLAGLGLFVSPFLFWPLGKWLLARRNAVPGDGFARLTFAISTVVIFALSFVTSTVFHWNAVAYAAMLPFLAAFARPRWLVVGQVAFGGLFIVLALINYALVPLTDVEGWRDEATAWSYGWADTAWAVRQAQADTGAGFVATADYTTASLLGFAMNDGAVTSLSTKIDQYDFWFDRAAHAGEDAVLLGDRWRPLRTETVAQFASVTELARLDVVRFGRLVDTHIVYLARDFRPGG
jgi:4-amino-4-deoxy-L-arabinose transferase-like glycosyltransferase